MKKIKILLAGTPSFSVPIFEKLLKNRDEFEVVGLVSQPDKPAKRGYKTEFTETKKLALKYGVKVFQPEKIGQIYAELKQLEFDYFLTAAFGQYIPMNVLELSKKASVNIHGSIVPKYRGAAPIQNAILNGETQTGITLIYMTKVIDSGHILKSANIKIDQTDTSETLFKKLSLLAAKNIEQWIKELFCGDFQEIIQDESLVTFAPKLLKENSLLKNDDTVEYNFNKIRAYSTNPGAYTYLNDKRIKIFYAQKEFKKNAQIFSCLDGDLYITDYQFESKKRIKIV